MAITVGNITTKTNISATFTFNNDKGDNNAVILTLTYDSNDATLVGSPTYAGETMTLGKRKVGAFQFTRTADVWYLLDATTGSNLFSTSWSSGSGVNTRGAAGTTLNGVDQDTPVHATGEASSINATSSSVSLSTVEDGLVIDSLFTTASTLATIGSGQTSIMSVNNGNGVSNMSHEAGTGSNVTMSWSAFVNNRSAHAVVSFAVAPAAAGGPTGGNSQSVGGLMNPGSGMNGLGVNV